MDSSRPSPANRRNHQPRRLAANENHQGCAPARDHLRRDSPSGCRRSKSQQHVAGMKTLGILFAISFAAKAQTQAWNVIERARTQYRASQHCDDLGQRTAVLALARANKLTRANLSNLCLTQIDLRDSNLSYANFSGSNLEGAILDKA